MNAEKIQSEIESDIDLLLTYMNDNLENLGRTVNAAAFSFLPDAGHRIEVDEKFGWTEDYLVKIINICHSRSLLTKNFGDNFAGVFLTDGGQSRAISVKHGKNRSYELGASVQIGMMNVNGPTQVGNGNVQNIHNIFNQLLQKIDESDAEEEEKKEAKSRLSKFLEHPLVASIVGGVASSLTGLAS